MATASSTNDGASTAANPGAFSSASKLVPYSIGVVAANKLLDSKDIEVTPIESFPMLGGELSDNVSTLESKGTAPDGTSYETKDKTTNSIQATWLPMHGSNRVTAPDVRRGELVQLYQFGDVDKYYWATLKDDLHLRKLETVIWAFSNTRKEDEKPSHDTTYYVEVSTHQKIVHLHMSDNDGEVTSYDMQFNGKEGFFVLQDGVGNYIKLNSLDKQFHIETAEGSFIDLTGGDLHVKLSGQYTLEAPKTVETTDREHIGNTHVTGNSSSGGSTSAEGNITSGANIAARGTVSGTNI